ncbi:P-loop containing nucleoside triphosphate hydrolase [Pseudocohnilembus persalinus]|uniref:RNA helicase n=1 Tax=Pseudocohnilembus persalinus TaxID=266149 RepID=A0A0V0QPS7_PSEPJ|nr:P-loop containing nucleoside triphosphate hydrolase [Pseudocohnilembus persalinus]|eukprot:KRX04274.1 P-loop containing nucleoside triphosphate hydrolase [Pseudocohnilembus persalinus]
MSYKHKDSQKYRYCPECRDDLSGLDTYECGCGYIICYDCYQDIKENKGNCPNCQKYYLQRTTDYNTERKKNNRYRQKQTYHKKNYNQDLTNVRVIKKNLVYCIGLSPQLANEELLSRNDYFGQYGNITKIVVNKENIYNAKGKTPSLSAFITYASEREASLAILAIEEYQIQDRTIRASYGTTKYCTSFLKNQECPNINDCLYLHSFGKDKDSFAKDEIQNNKNIFVEQQRIAIKCIQKYIPELVKQKVAYDLQKPKPSLPHPSTIIDKLIQVDAIDQNKFQQIYSQEQQRYEADTQNRKKQNEQIKIKKNNEQPLVDQWDIEIPVVKQNKAQEENNSLKPSSQDEYENCSNQDKKQVKLNVLHDSFDEYNNKKEEQNNQQNILKEEEFENHLISNKSEKIINSNKNKGSQNLQKPLSYENEHSNNSNQGKIEKQKPQSMTTENQQKTENLNKINTDAKNEQQLTSQQFDQFIQSKKEQQNQTFLSNKVQENNQCIEQQQQQKINTQQNQINQAFQKQLEINNQQESIQQNMINQLFDDNLNNQATLQNDLDFTNKNVNNNSNTAQMNEVKDNELNNLKQKQGYFKNNNNNDQQQQIFGFSKSFNDQHKQNNSLLEIQNQQKMNYTQSLSNIENIINQNNNNKKSSRFDFANNSTQNDNIQKIKSEGNSDLTGYHEQYPLTRSMKRKFIYHSGPTNSGKTYEAIQRLSKAKSGLYCAPLRLLAWEVQQKMEEFDEVQCDLLTGQEKIIREGSQITSCTVELAVSKYVQQCEKTFDVAVLDEVQMVGDFERGSNWTSIILGLPAEEIHLCGDPKAFNVIKNIIKQCGDEFEERTYFRRSDLVVQKQLVDYKDLQSGDCLIAYSVQKLFEIRKQINQITNEDSCAILYGRLPPQVRKQQANLFNSGQYKYLIATDVVGMGLNFNINRIIFTELKPFNRLQNNQINSYLQIGGRAGRNQNVGYVACTNHEDLSVIQNAFQRNSSYYHYLKVRGNPKQCKKLKNILSNLHQLQFYNILVSTYKSHQIENFKKFKGFIKKVGIFPSIMQIKDLKQLLEEKTGRKYKLSQVVLELVKNAKIEGNYFIQKHLEFRIQSDLIDHLELDIQHQFIFAQAPINLKKKEGLAAQYLIKFATEFKNQDYVQLPSMVDEIEQEESFQSLQLLQDKYNVCELYTWLHYKFPDKFIDLNNAIILQEKIILRIDSILKKL